MILFLIATATVASYLIAWALGVPALVPVLNTAAAFPFMVASLRAGRVRQAIGRMLLWALVMGVSATALSYWRPEASARQFIHADQYRREMFAWILTGEGEESDPKRFVPVHIAHAATFCGLSFASGGVLGMPMGAVLMNYMGHYVGALAAESSRPVTVALVAWHPWSLVRIISFVALGVVLSGPVLGRVARFEFRLRDQRRWIVGALVGLVLDIVLKWLLAPVWQEWLRHLISS